MQGIIEIQAIHITGATPSTPWGFPGLPTGASVKEILFRKVSLADILPKPDSAIPPVFPLRPRSSTTLGLTKDVWEPGSKKHLTTFLQPLDPQKQQKQSAGSPSHVSWPQWKLLLWKTEREELQMRILIQRILTWLLLAETWLVPSAGDCDVYHGQIYRAGFDKLQLCDQFQECLRLRMANCFPVQGTLIQEREAGKTP